MGQVVIEINQRTYTMQCADGEEAHLRHLAGLLDAEVNGIRDVVGAVGDLRLLLMAGLMIADKLGDNTRQIEAMREQIEGLRQSRNQMLDQQRELEDQLAEQIESASERLEALAASLR